MHLKSRSVEIFLKDKWMYCDDISLDYAFAQSVLFKIYGKTVQETGHKTKGAIGFCDQMFLLMCDPFFLTTSSLHCSFLVIA